MSLEYDEKKIDGDAFTQAVTPAGETPVVDYGGEAVEGHNGLKRQMKSRHIAMISIGGVIGTGLFLGTGSALANGGPGGLLLGYVVMASVCLCTMVSLGEMISYLPVQGGHIKLAERFVDPSLSFAMGWNYWYNWLIILPAEISAAAVLINYWNQSVNNAVWMTMCLVVVVVINFLGAGAFGEAEFWFASIKVLTIVGLIILGIIISAGGGPEGDPIGFKYWNDPGAFVQYHGIAGTTGRFLGFVSVLMQAAFSFIGTEIVALCAGEAKNPRRNIPRAIKRVFVRIVLFYIGGVFVIGIIVPSNAPGLRLNEGTAKSPWVIAIRAAGIKALPSIINACLLTSAWSAASADLYTSSRALYGLAITRQAPQIFARTTRRGTPWVSLIVSTLFGGLAYMALQSTAGTVFGYLANLTAAAGLMTWWSICFCYIRFHKGLKVQGIERSSLPYASKLNKGAFAAWYAIILISVILFFSGFAVFLSGNWSAANFVTNYLPIFLFPVLFLFWKFFKKTRFVRAAEMDFYSGLEEVEADSYDEPPPKHVVEKVWRWVM